MNSEQKFIEIPFGANDSELKGWEYTIPEGMEAIVKDGKVIVKEKESEDERIRKFLVELLSSGTWKREWPFQPNECVAYLEKQKEQKPAEWGEEDEQMLSYIICAIRDHYTADPIKDKLINWLQTRPFQISAQWDVEQQWCFEDVIALLIADGHEREANVLKTLFNQSKIGLSKKEIDNAIDDYNSGRKQEWSEEDVDMLNSCISSIEEAKENRYAYKETDGDTSYDHEIAWLKSLRPKRVDVSDQTLQLLICYLYACHDVAKRDWEKADCRRYISYLEDLDYTLKNRWKPSEEDLDAIKELIDDANKRGWATPGASRLYEQLKNL